MTIAVTSGIVVFASASLMMQKTPAGLLITGRVFFIRVLLQLFS